MFNELDAINRVESIEESNLQYDRNIEKSDIPLGGLKPLKVRTLTCACCGIITRGRQWWNQDLKMGICPSCAVSEFNSLGEEGMHLAYGKRGYHYAV